MNAEPFETGDILYRPAAPADAGAIAALFRATRQACLPYLPELHTKEEDRVYFSTDVLRTKIVWVAECKKRILGFCAFKDGWLDHLYVAQTFQRHGIGAKLLGIALSTEHNTLDLWVFQQNVPAIRFYEALGFKLVKKTDGSENEERVPDALYRFSL